MNYEKDAQIDESALDIEILEQPRLMMKYAEHSANTKRDADEADEELNIVRAELDKKIRQNPDAYGVDKITETVVSNTILLQPEYKEASKKRILANYEANMAKLAVQTISSRKDCLEAMVKLHGQLYFAGPKIPRDLTHEALQRREQGEVDKKIKPLTRKKVQA